MKTATAPAKWEGWADQTAYLSTRYQSQFTSYTFTAKCLSFSKVRRGGLKSTRRMWEAKVTVAPDVAQHLDTLGYVATKETEEGVYTLLRDAILGGFDVDSLSVEDRQVRVTIKTNTHSFLSFLSEITPSFTEKT